jgi:hypothetical protein
MGKNWKGPRNHGGGKSFTSDIASCRGHAVVVATCDNLRGREASKELVNLLNEAMDTLYPDLSSNQDSLEADEAQVSRANMSIQQLLDQEIKQANQSKTSVTSTQNVITVQTDVNCVILAKITKPGLCPVKLVEEIFNRLEREKKPLCKNIVRMIPLKDVFFPRTDELLEHLYSYMLAEFPGIELPAAKIELNRQKIAKQDERLSAKPDDAAATTEHAEGETNESEEKEESSKKRQRSASYDADEEAILRREGLLTIPSAPPSSAITGASSSSTTAYPAFTCEILFKARNHNLLTKSSVLETVTLCKPAFMNLTYMKPQVSRYSTAS